MRFARCVIATFIKPTHQEQFTNLDDQVFSARDCDAAAPLTTRSMCNALTEPSFRYASSYRKALSAGKFLAESHQRDRKRKYFRKN